MTQGSWSINRERLVERFLKYVQIDSPTKSEGNFAQVLASALTALGLEVHIDNAGEALGSDTGNILARLEGNCEGEPILLSCHMDTVSPGIGIKPIIRDGTIYSDGTTILGADNKAGIAAIIEALLVIKERQLKHPTIEIAFSIYEEGGLHGAKAMDMGWFQSKMAYVLDSGGDPGQIVTSGPAQDKVDAYITGKPAHAGVCPEEGINALMVAAKAIESMKLLRIDAETTANIGRIEGGGATNIVVPSATVYAEARSLDSEKLKAQSEHMKACFEAAAAFYGAQVDVKITRMYEPFVIAEDAPIVARVKAACEALGLPSFTDSTGGGSDTNVFNGKGIQAVNLGIGERKPHTLEEHLHIVDLENTARLIVLLGTCSCGTV